MQHFNEAGLPQALFHRLEQIGLTIPTPIQAKSIPLALEGKDILGSAQTGTGKTAAFGIPLITKLLNDEDSQALVLLPTRELAAQVMKSFSDFIGKSKIGHVLLIGGEPIAKQLGKLKTKPRLFIGTPGRVTDHLKRKSLRLDKVNFLVLDEVDRMLDMGFGIQLEEIAKYLTAKERQTLMFSATMPRNINKLAARYLKDPERISVGSTFQPAKNVKQSKIDVKANKKESKLIEELDSREGSVIIFVATKRSADKIALKLRGMKYKAEALHGDLRQHKRTRIVQDFHSKKYRILVATDVAARGLDIPHIEHVINYDLPQKPEDYIHRIGRTARAGAEGEAINFVSPSDAPKWRAISRLLNPRDGEDGGYDSDEFEYKKPRTKSGDRKKFGGGKSFEGKSPRGRGSDKSFGRDDKPRRGGSSSRSSDKRSGKGGDDRDFRKSRSFEPDRDTRSERSENRSSDSKPSKSRKPYEGGDNRGGRKPSGSAGGSRRPSGDRNRDSRDRDFGDKPKRSSSAPKGKARPSRGGSSSSRSGGGDSAKPRPRAPREYVKPKK